MRWRRFVYFLLTEKHVTSTEMSGNCEIFQEDRRLSSNERKPLEAAGASRILNGSCIRQQIQECRFPLRSHNTALEIPNNSVKNPKNVQPDVPFYKNRFRKLPSR